MKNYILAAFNTQHIKFLSRAVVLFLIGKAVSWLILKAISIFELEGDLALILHSVTAIDSILFTFVLGLIGFLILQIIEWLISDFFEEYKKQLKSLNKIDEKESVSKK